MYQLSYGFRAEVRVALWELSGIVIFRLFGDPTSIQTLFSTECKSRWDRPGKLCSTVRG